MNLIKITALAAGIVLSLTACENEIISFPGELAVNDIVLPEQNADMNPGKDEELNKELKSNQKNPENEKLFNPQGAVNIQDWDKKIIKTANLNLEINDFKTFGELVHDQVKKAGGYIAQEQQKETEYSIENNIIIKVPVNQFDNVMNALTSAAVKTIGKNISAEDVTMQTVDVRSRLEAKKQVRARYTELLKQAKNMEDVLNVQSEINQIQEEIEATSGKLNYLKQSASFSTIHINYHQVLNPGIIDNDPAYNTRIWSSFKNGWIWIGEVFIGIISIWPLWLFGLTGWLMVRKTFSKKLKQA